MQAASNCQFEQEIEHSCYYNNQYRRQSVGLYQVESQPPMAAKHPAYGQYTSAPDNRTDRGCSEETAKRHTRDTGGETGKWADIGYYAREKDHACARGLKPAFNALYLLRVNVQSGCGAQQKLSAAVPADHIGKTGSQDTPRDRCNDQRKNVQASKRGERPVSSKSVLFTI